MATPMSTGAFVLVLFAMFVLAFGLWLLTAVTSDVCINPDRFVISMNAFNGKFHF
jgi:hypothetical protein